MASSVAPEGRIILLPLLSLAILVGLGLQVIDQLWLTWGAIAVWALTGLAFIFFRDPIREPPDNTLAVVSPADGRVVDIRELNHDEYLGDEAVQISIFLSIFNVHTQRVPFDALVENILYRPGKFLAAFKPNAGEENEQAVTLLSTSEGKLKVKQIAGILARRIICYMQPGMMVRRGERLGFIRLGSRVELVVPSSFRLQVKVGDRVQGARHILGYFSSCS